MIRINQKIDHKININSKRKKHIVLTTFGSLGDVYPYIAIALELKARGHRAVIATSEIYRQNIEAENIEFYPIRPNGLPNADTEWQFFKLLQEYQRGIEYIICYVLIPHLRATYNDLMAATTKADLLLSHPLTLPVSLVAEKRNIPWISTALSPSSFMSAYSSDNQPTTPLATYEHGLNMVAKDVFLRHLRWNSRFWSGPVRQLRRELGLPPSYDPIHEGQYAPKLVLALFSRFFAAAQPDWPSQTRVSGFTFYDRIDRKAIYSELADFLAAGPPPIVFTLGSSAVSTPGNFYLEGAAAAKQLGYRAVLLMGKEAENIRNYLPEGVVAFDYAPHSEIFPAAAAIVHHGGVGTTGQALRSGRPMLVVPHGYEQPENAARVVNLGVGRTIDRSQYTASVVADELNMLLSQPSYTNRCLEVSRLVQTEDGVQTACNSIETYLQEGVRF